MIAWFGPAPFAVACNQLPQQPTPIGQLCQWCQEEITSDDCGFMVNSMVREKLIKVPVHVECQLRRIVGGINHQLKICRCCGGINDPDPPGISDRAAAKLAMDYWYASDERRTT
jgi:hypothetical protein